MGIWEYRTVRIVYEGKEHKDWIVRRVGQTPLVGLSLILEAYGIEGWELVSMNPERMEAYAGFAKWHIEPVEYRATFKRPRGE